MTSDPDGNRMNGYSSEEDEPSSRLKLSDLSITVSNVPQILFDDATIKAEFEALVQSCGDTATFFYLKQISRVRVDYTKVVSASWAVQNLKGRLIHNCPLRVQRSGIVVGTDSHLKPPKPQKQFLISPPSSPPVDWEPPRENAPTIAPVNFELLAAVAGLSSEPFELHSSSAVDQPSIMVIAPQNEEDDKHESTDNDSLRHAIAGSKLHTSRPPIPK